MTDYEQKTHDDQVVDQFTKQADAYVRKLATNDGALRLAREITGLSAADAVIDIACGPGLVACDFAQVARRVIGVDLTPVMLDRARQRQAEQRLDNLGWAVASAESLPFGAGAFSLTFSRYTFHHLMQPRRALAEMMRVCRPGGRVAVFDIGLEPGKADAFNRMEKLRDPSHVRAMSGDELLSMVADAGLTDLRTGTYGSEVELETQLRSSFPEPGAEAKLRRIFEDDLTTNALGMGTHRRDGAVYIAYPILMVVGTKAG